MKQKRLQLPLKNLTMSLKSLFKKKKDYEDCSTVQNTPTPKNWFDFIQQ